MPEHALTPDPPATLADALRAFAHTIRTVAVPAVAGFARAAGPAVVWLAGFRAGYELRPRDWEAPDDWHRGWLRGRLAWVKERQDRRADVPPVITERPR